MKKHKKKGVEEASKETEDKINQEEGVAAESEKGDETEVEKEENEGAKRGGNEEAADQKTEKYEDRSGPRRQRTSESETSREQWQRPRTKEGAAAQGVQAICFAAHRRRSLAKMGCWPDVLDQGRPKEEEEGEEEGYEEGTEAEAKKKKQEERNRDTHMQQGKDVKQKKKEGRRAEMVFQIWGQFFDLMGQAQHTRVSPEKNMGFIQSVKVISAIILGQSPRSIVTNCNENMLKIVNIENTVTCYRQWDPGGGILVSPFTLRTR